MSSKVNIEDAQAHLQQIIAALNPGEQVTITKDGGPVATLTRPSLKTWRTQGGYCQKYVALDGSRFRCAP